MREPDPAAVEAFFSRDPLEVAPELLGSTLTAHGVTLELTEVEAYRGACDPASHAFRGPTPRNRVMFGPAGRVYVYLSYGMHNCVNLVCDVEGRAGAVLLRGARVALGLEQARERRGPDPSQAALARGPGNLSRALGVDLAGSGSTLWDGPMHWRPRRCGARAVLAGPRVGISRAADLPWRFWLGDEPSVSAYRRSSRAPSAGIGPSPEVPDRDHPRSRA